jgi:FkbM family methyltransferase
MLISFDEIRAVTNLDFTGALHIGAHDCEEIPFYQRLNVPSVIWIDAMKDKVDQATARAIPNVYHAVVTDQDNQEVTFHVANNGQSSSVLEFGTHSQEHPWVTYVQEIKQKTTTIDTFFSKNRIDPSVYTFWNFDIQGAELMALKGATHAIQYAKALYLEVNEKELYQGCALLPELDAFLDVHGFQRMLTCMTEHGWGDALYLKKA